MSAPPYKHLVVFSTHFWGHSRPMCTLVARIVKLRPILITFLTVHSVHSRAVAELARDFQPGEEHLVNRIRVVALDEGTEADETSGAPGVFKAAWDRLCNDQALTCAKTGTRFEALPVRPGVALLDSFAVDAHDIVREISGDTVKVYTWFPLSTNAFYHAFSEDKYPQARAEAARTGRPVLDVAYEMMWRTSGALMHSPCFPTIHDYEMHPQGFRLPKLLVANVIIRIAGAINKADGLITFDAADYHPQATDAIRQHFAEKSQKAFYAGPLMPSGAQAAAKEMINSENGGEIMAFLDEKLKSAGEHSVLYLSFGSLFWPPDPAKLWAVVDVLMEKNIPFVMSHGASMASPLPDDVKARIEKYGNAIVSDWVPQQALLEHPATGWSLMHGGHNGTLESITAGVPMIVWPIDADQPMNAIYLADDINVAYELIEVRGGCGLGKIFRDGRTPAGTIDAVKEEMRSVLDRAFGSDGAEKRARLQGLRKKLQAAWVEDGVARREVSAFLDEF
ncbi:hypothetical protein VTO73DRAFT_6661 [Trametes versicolor]